MKLKSFALVMNDKGHPTEAVDTSIDEEALKSVNGSRELPYNGLEQECREEIYKQYYRQWAAEEYYYLVHRVQYFNPSQSIFIQPTFQFNDIGKVETGFF